MRKMLATFALGTALTLGGCVTPGNSNIIEQVRHIASTACAFLPTVETVAEILAAGNPTLQTAGAIANAICAAINRPMSVRGRVPTVAGVPIRGTRL